MQNAFVPPATQPFPEDFYLFGEDPELKIRREKTKAEWTERGPQTLKLTFYKETLGLNRMQMESEASNRVELGEFEGDFSGGMFKLSLSYPPIKGPIPYNGEITKWRPKWHNNDDPCSCYHCYDSLDSDVDSETDSVS